jgi:hypothetical protein
MMPCSLTSRVRRLVLQLVNFRFDFFPQQIKLWITRLRLIAIFDRSALCFQVILGDSGAREEPATGLFQFKHTK